MITFQEACGSTALLGAFTETRPYFQALRSGDLSDGSAIRRIEWSKRNGSGHLAAGVGCVSETIYPWKVCAVLRLHRRQSLTYPLYPNKKKRIQIKRRTDISAVIRYAVAAIYTNFATTIIDSEGFNYHGKWVTGKPGDRLILMFENLGVAEEK